jgi:hypothetical protein
MQDYLTLLDKYMRLRNFSYRTIKSYNYSLNIFLKYIKFDLSKINVTLVEDFLLSLYYKNYSYKTVNLYYNVIKLFCNEIL